MRIIDLVTSVNLGKHEASRTHALGIAHGLQEIDGNRVTLVVGGDQAERMEEGGLEILVLKQSSLTAEVGFCSKVWRSFSNTVNGVLSFRALMATRPDVVYERQSIGSLVGIGLARLARVPLVFEVNGIPDQEIMVDLGLSSATLRTLLFHMMRVHLRQADAIIVQSVELKAAISDRYSIGADRVHIVGNGSDAVLPQKEYRGLGGTGCPRMCFVGQLDGSMHDLSEVLNALKALDNDFVFSVVGGGRKTAEYAALVERDARFRFTGPVSHDEAMCELAGSDLCIAEYSGSYPLFQEYGFYLCPLKVLEYMAYGKPCVYYGPVNSVVGALSRDNAILATQDIRAFGAAVKTLLESPEARRTLGSKAGSTSREYTWNSSALKTMRVIESVTLDAS